MGSRKCQHTVATAATAKLNFHWEKCREAHTSQQQPCLLIHDTNTQAHRNTQTLSQSSLSHLHSHFIYGLTLCHTLNYPVSWISLCHSVLLLYKKTRSRLAHLFSKERMLGARERPGGTSSPKCS